LKKVFIFEFQDIRYASRARKEAFSLSKEGYQVTLIGFNSNSKKRNTHNQNGVKIIEYPLRFDYKKSFLHKFLAVILFNIKLLPYFILNKADIYHAHNLKVLYLSLIGKKLFNAKLIYDAHELHTEKRELKTKLSKILCKKDYKREKRYVRNADLVLQANYKRSEHFKKIYNTKLPITIENHNNIIEIKPNKNSISKLIGVNNANIIVFTGFISIGGNQKIDNVIRALKFLPDNYVLVTIGPYKEDIKNALYKIAEEDMNEKRVFILPPVLSEEVVPLISTASVAVIPIYANCLNSEYSALNKFSQSLMAGLPIVSSNYENLSKMIINNNIGPVGELFNVEDPDLIAKAIEKCFETEEKYQHLKNNAFALAEKFINWENEEKKLFKAYDKLFTNSNEKRSI